MVSKMYFQTGFLKGRFIGENIRLIDGLINHTAARNISGLLMFLDFERLTPLNGLLYGKC